MPVMDGAKALAAMRELRPGLRSLLMSGEGNPAPGGDPTIPPGMVCLPKPFHLGKLLEAVADALAPAHNP